VEVQITYPPTISKMLGMEADAIESSSPISIKQVFVFGARTQ